MYIAPENLYQIARMRMEDRQSFADRYRLAKEARVETRTSGFDKLQSLLVFIGMVLQALGESLRSPIPNRAASTSQPSSRRNSA